MSKELEEILDRWKLYISLTKDFSNKDMELIKIEELEELLDYITNLQQENKQLKEIIYNAKDFCKRYLSLNLEAFDTYGLLGKLLEILGDKENEHN